MLHTESEKNIHIYVNVCFPPFFTYVLHIFFIKPDLQNVLLLLWRWVANLIVPIQGNLVLYIRLSACSTRSFIFWLLNVDILHMVIHKYRFALY